MSAEAHLKEINDMCENQDGGGTVAQCIGRKIARIYAATNVIEQARNCESLKMPCGEDPESPQAIRNGSYQGIALNLRAIVGRLRAQQPQGGGKE